MHSCGGRHRASGTLGGPEIKTTATATTAFQYDGLQHSTIDAGALNNDALKYYALVNNTKANGNAKTITNIKNHRKLCVHKKETFKRTINNMKALNFGGELIKEMTSSSTKIGTLKSGALLHSKRHRTTGLVKDLWHHGVWLPLLQHL